MVLPMLFGVLILFVVVYITFRLLGNVLYGVVMIVLIFIASYLILGSFPNLTEVPVIGRWLPDLSQFRTTGSAISVIKGVFYKLEVLDYAHTRTGNLLVVVANRGSMDLSGYNVTVNGQLSDILNDPKETLASGESAVIEVGWRGGFESITVESGNAAAIYPAE
jgi:hypothetical protein